MLSIQFEKYMLKNRDMGKASDLFRLMCKRAYLRQISETSGHFTPL